MKNIHVRERLNFLYCKLLPIVLIYCYIYRWLESLKLTWNIHKHIVVICTFQNNSCAFALLLDAQGCKKCVIQSERTFSSFHAFWDNPREVVIIQLWLVVNGWDIMMSSLSLYSFTRMFLRTFFVKQFFLLSLRTHDVIIQLWSCVKWMGHNDIILIHL